MTNDGTVRFSLIRVIKVVSVVIGVALLVMAVPLIAERVMPWRLVSSASPVPLAKGATYVVKKIKGPVETELHLVFFDAASCRLAVVAQDARQTALSVADAAAAANAIAACNGGYFDVKAFTPAGFQIANGKRDGKITSNPLAGYVATRNGVPEIATLESFKDDPSVTEYLDCNPLYVMDGRALKLGYGPRNTRTFVMTDQRGHWAIGVCRNLGLQELADILTTTSIISEMKVERALNLDGGPWSSLWCKGKGEPIQPLKEGWRVKNLLVVLPKQ